LLLALLLAHAVWLVVTGVTRPRRLVRLVPVGVCWSCSGWHMARCSTPRCAWTGWPPPVGTRGRTSPRWPCSSAARCVGPRQERGQHGNSLRGEPVTSRHASVST